MEIMSNVFHPKNYVRFERSSSFVIILSAVLLTIESIYHSNTNLTKLLSYFDLVILGFVVVEMIYRLRFFPFQFKDIISSFKRIFLKMEIADDGIVCRYKEIPEELRNPEDASDVDSVSKICLEQSIWLIFDLVITISSIAAIFFINLFILLRSIIIRFHFHYFHKKVS